MRPRPINLPLRVSRELGALPDVTVIYTLHSPMLGPQYNRDEIELDMRNASSQSKSYVREIAQDGWTILDEDAEFWVLKSDYYPLSPEEMVKVRDPETNTA